MSFFLRLLLLLGAISMVYHIIKLIRKSKVQMKDTVSWLIVAFLLAVFGIFPQVPQWISSLIGIESPANMVFLLFITILIFVVFSLSLRVSLLEDKVVTLAAEVAIRTEEKEEKKTE